MASSPSVPVGDGVPGNGARLHSMRLRAVLWMLGPAAVALPALLVAYGPNVPMQPSRAPVRHGKVVPPTVLPPVEPVEMKPVTPDEARAYNASIPFVRGPTPPARPFRFKGNDLDRERALDCLATAELYEAGDDSDGERAVAQVVLNRVRHPAFQRTVCGVVFEGSERSTGCQFTFTCDGALAHVWSDAAWKRARTVAEQALSGRVDRRIGTATHYHTDWVVPYWSASLDKIAKVGSHLFFRWTGWWGTPPAFRMGYSGCEPRFPVLGDRFPAHAGEATDPAGATGQDAATLADAELPKPIATDDDLFLVTLDPNLDPATLSTLASRACGARKYCKFLAWLPDGQKPSALPLSPAALNGMAFSYLRDRSLGYEKSLWNCRIYPTIADATCMVRRPGDMLSDDGKNAQKRPAEAQPLARTPKDAVPDSPVLSGVRRKSETPSVPAATSAADTRGDDKG